RAGEADAAARDLAGAGVSVHAVAVGSAEPTGRVRDVAVRGLRAPDRVFAGNRAEVRATVATLGLKGASVEVVLSAGGEEVARREISPAAQRTAEEVVFAPVLEQVGPVRLSLAAAPLGGELVATNNRAETTVRVEKGGIRVLYLEGRLRPEGKYLARVLADAREIDLERRLLVGQGAGAAAPKPADLDGFDVVILGDLPAGVLPPAALRRLAGRVRDGETSVLTVGGLDAYGPGGWAGTAVADVLPFAIQSSDEQIDGPLAFRPTSEGLEHFVFRGDEGEAVPPPDHLPPLAGANAVGEVRPGARLLARAEDGASLLAVRTLGDGRVASATFDTTWQWALAAPQTGGPAMHERLWRRLVLWLARRDGRPHEDLWITTDRTQYVVADPDRPPEAEVTVGVRGEARPTVRLDGPASAPVSLSRRDGTGAGRTEWRGRVPLAVPGAYTVVAEAVVDGEAKRAEAHLAAREQDFELASLLTDADRLKAVAAAGGGSCRPLDGLPDVLTQVAASLEPHEVPAERRVRLARGRVFLGAFIALMAAEWVLRRRWGLA
ncbi:MAG: glutamine amidotransferase, partial [Phycisphaerae bacterium]